GPTVRPDRHRRRGRGARLGSRCGLSGREGRPRGAGQARGRLSLHRVRPDQDSGQERPGGEPREALRGVRHRDRRGGDEFPRGDGRMEGAVREAGKHDEADHFRGLGVEVFEGQEARFDAPDEVAVDGRRL
ncbi:MAG: Mercuric ion reductase, partial [uncultured Rubrobacteraceae bacterium]